MNTPAMKTALLWLAAAVVFVTGLLVYRHEVSIHRWHVDPHAAEEIEKAMHR